MYQEHPSKKLNELFASKPFQGVNPLDAKFVFVGLDANYANNLEEMSIYDKVLEYHLDAVKFWRTYGVHHPFLMPSYRGDGQYYHKSFARIGFTPRHAGQVSFVELLHKPTVGRSKIEINDLSEQHLKFIKDIIFNGKAKYIFIPAGVANIFRKTKYGNWLPKTPLNREPLYIWYKRNNITVYKHLHFSVYGKYEQQKRIEIDKISGLIT